jgi:hypothetical protein
MTKSSLLSTAAILAVIATSAMAQEAMQEPGAYAQAHPWATDYYYRYGPAGFWRGSIVVDGVIGGRRPVVTVPLDSYAYYGGGTDDNFYASYYGDRPVTRLTRCGLQSGATYLGPDGRWHPC